TNELNANVWRRHNRDEQRAGSRRWRRSTPPKRAPCLRFVGLATAQTELLKHTKLDLLVVITDKVDSIRCCVLPLVTRERSRLRLLWRVVVAWRGGHSRERDAWSCACFFCAVSFFCFISLHERIGNVRPLVACSLDTNGTHR
ncbi:hypothetical protein BIW11_07975, partial [Tropilaelaps mercedesae]